MASLEKGGANRFQGIEYFWDAVKGQGKNRHEAALALVHWLLIGNGYRCIGRDTQFPATREPSRVGSEKLPENWNDRSAGFYSLLYVHPSHPSNMYLIKLIPAGSINDGVILGQILISTAAEDVVSFELNSHKFIPENWTTISSPTDYPEFKSLTEFVDKEIIGKMQGKRGEVGQSSTLHIGQVPPPPSRHIPFTPDIGPPLREFVPPGNPRGNPFALGSRDLDPFGGMGGNVMGPGSFHPSGFPGGGMSSGRPYRYDPIVPPEFGPMGGLGGPSRPPFHGDPSGIGAAFPERGNPLGVGAVPGVGMGRMRPAPLQPGEPDPDHELPPRPPGDDLNNMFM